MFTIFFVTNGRDVSSAVYSSFGDALAEGAEHCDLALNDAREGGDWFDEEAGRTFRGGVSEALAFRIVAAD
jgi:hypothetical protein